MAKPKRAVLLVALVLVAALVAGAMLDLRSPPKRAPNVVVVLLDTLRADHVGTYGYERQTTPAIDEFARRNATFVHAFTAAPWTPPSVASIFTGLYQSSHGMTPPRTRDEARSSFDKLNGELVTMAEFLKARGYRTAALSRNPWISREFGYAQGFDQFKNQKNADAAQMTEESIKVIEKLGAPGAEAPFFVYIHYLDPHFPYTPPSGYERMFVGPLLAPAAQYDADTKQQIDLYDAEIRFTDDQVKVLLDHLAARPDYDDTLIVVVGDHGEQFRERGHTGHGHDLFNEETRVPLIVKPPGKEQARRFEQVVSTIDILPTVLVLATGDAPDHLPGLDLFDERALDARRGVMTELRLGSSLRGFVDARGKKLIVDSSSEATAAGAAAPVIGVFDSLGAGMERTRLEDPRLLEALRSELQACLQLALARRPAGGNAAAEVDHATIEELESLGY